MMRGKPAYSAKPLQYGAETKRFFLTLPRNHVILWKKMREGDRFSRVKKLKKEVLV
jgi:hypothetical protein